VAWLPTLEKAVASLAAAMHPDFRLWLTTEPHPLFPPILLQNSLKITFESPPGIKKNLQRTLGTWGRDFIDGTGAASPAKGEEKADSGAVPRRRGQLLFLLAWFHAVVQERRTYLPQGWSKAYEFSVGDLRAGTMVLDTVSRAEGGLDLNLIHGLMEDAIYGGRVDNPSDLRVLRTYITRLFSHATLGNGSRNQPELTRGVRLPAACSFDELSRWAAALPDDDAPSIFGLPDAIQRALQRSLSAGVAAGLRSLSVSSEGSSKFDREKWRSGIGPLLDLWQSLSEADDHAPKGGAGMTPTDQFVLFENDSAVELCRFVSGQVAALRKVAFGSALLTPSIHAVGSALLRGEVPPSWEKRWGGPETAVAWLTTLARKKKALAGWAAAAASGGRLLSSPLHLSDLFNPGTFLNALRQQSARRLGVPLEGTKLISAFDASKLGGAQLQVTLDGLLVENACVERDELADAGTAELSRSPTLTLAYVGLDHPEPYRGHKGETLTVPVYHSASREKHLVDLRVLVGGEPATWILAGAAFLLSAD